MQGVMPVDGLSFKEVLVYLLVPLLLGSFAYSWLQAHALWEGIKELRAEVYERMQEMKENDLHSLEQRIERLERRP